jgi:hypothetical protein
MTPDQHPNLPGQLIDLDAPASPAARAEHERRLAALFERRLTALDWIRLCLMGAGGLAGAAVCGTLALTEPAGMPTATRVALALLAAMGLSWAALAGLIVRRRSIHSATHGSAAAHTGFAFTLVTAAAIAILTLARPAQAAPAGLLLLPLAALALAAVVLVVHHVKQAELRLRRDVLEMHYAVAELKG